MQPQPQPVEVKTIQQELMEYEEMLAMRDVLMLRAQDLRSSVIPQELQIELDNIEHEYAPKLEAADQRIDEMKKHLQARVKQAGVRVDGRNVQVIYQKPSWKIKDLVKLLQLAIKTPEIMECLEQGEPVAKVQAMKGGKV